MTPEIKKTTLVAIPVTAIVTVVIAAGISLSNQSAIAISVAEQHGSELELLRRDYSALRGELVSLREDLRTRMDDRFKGADARAMEARLMNRIERLERKHE